MKSKIGWQWSEDTLKAIIANIIIRKYEYEEELEANDEFGKGVVAGYTYVIDSIKNELECRGYDFEEFMKVK